MTAELFEDLYRIDEEEKDKKKKMVAAGCTQTGGFDCAFVICQV